MRNFLLSCLIFPASCLFAQFSDDFSDGNFTSAPVWSGDSGEFEIESGMLNSNGPAVSSTLHLSTPSTSIADAEWDFLIRLDFNPSTSNYVRIYFISNASDLEASLNGYFLELGETGTDDTIRIYRQDGIAETAVFKGNRAAMPGSTTNTCRIRIKRDALGNFTVYSDPLGGSAFSAEGGFTDATYSSTTHFGVWCKYSTVSRASLFYFDDFYAGPEIVDVTAPSLDSVWMISQTEVAALFNESLDPVSAQNVLHYNMGGNPATAILDATNPALVHLKFSPLTASTSYTLQVNNIQDVTGNNLLSGELDFYYAGWNDLIFSEIFMAPDTQLSEMPDAEFIEIYNRTDYNISIANWNLFDAAGLSSGSSATISDGYIAPHSYSLLTSTTNLATLSTYGPTSAVTSFPSLNNDAEELLLTNHFGQTIHYLAYTDEYYHDALRADGGYSIERLDLNINCSGSENWKASLDSRGASPAAVNSQSALISDNTPPSLEYAEYVNDQLIVLVFSESMNNSSITNVSNYMIQPAIGIDSLYLLPYGNYRALVFLNSPMSPATIYTVELSGVSDCNGNEIGVNKDARFGIPEALQAGDLLINEVLFNPFSNGSDFVELFNASSKILVLNNIALAEASSENPGLVTDFIWLNTGRLIFPGDYPTICTNREDVQDFYIAENPEFFMESNDMPNFADDEGVVLLKTNTILLDSFFYSDTMHFPLLDATDGVSLERIDTKVSAAYSSNWHSASSTAGYATPTYVNSQSRAESIAENILTADLDVFSPNNDGFRDFVELNVSPEYNSYTGSLYVFDVNGVFVKAIANNVLLGNTNHFRWDGLDAKNQRCRTGIYFVVAELFDLDANKKHGRIKVVLAN